jgi:hypothetical protein
MNKAGPAPPPSIPLILILTDTIRATATATAKRASGFDRAKCGEGLRKRAARRTSLRHAYLTPPTERAAKPSERPFSSEEFSEFLGSLSLSFIGHDAHSRYTPTARIFLCLFFASCALGHFLFFLEFNPFFGYLFLVGGWRDPTKYGPCSFSSLSPSCLPLVRRKGKGRIWME